MLCSNRISMNNDRRDDDWKGNEQGYVQDGFVL